MITHRSSVPASSTPRAKQPAQRKPIPVQQVASVPAQSKAIQPTTATHAKPRAQRSPPPVTRHTESNAAHAGTTQRTETGTRSDEQLVQSGAISSQNPHKDTVAQAAVDNRPRPRPRPRPVQHTEQIPLAPDLQTNVPGKNHPHLKKVQDVTHTVMAVQPQTNHLRPGKLVI